MPGTSPDRQAFTSGRVRAGFGELGQVLLPPLRHALADRAAEPVHRPDHPGGEPAAELGAEGRPLLQPFPPGGDAGPVPGPDVAQSEVIEPRHVGASTMSATVKASPMTQLRPWARVFSSFSNADS